MHLEYLMLEKHLQFQSLKHMDVLDFMIKCIMTLTKAVSLK